MKSIEQGNGKEWTGMTLDQLAYERAVTLARVEIEKHRLSIELDRARQGNILFSRSTFSRLLSIVSFTDMVVVGVKLWRSLSPVFSKKKR